MFKRDNGRRFIPKPTLSLSLSFIYYHTFCADSEISGECVAVIPVTRLDHKHMKSIYFCIVNIVYKELTDKYLYIIYIL